MALVLVGRRLLLDVWEREETAAVAAGAAQASGLRTSPLLVGQLQ